MVRRWKVRGQRWWTENRPEKSWAWLKSERRRSTIQRSIVMNSTQTAGRKDPQRARSALSVHVSRPSCWRGGVSPSGVFMTTFVASAETFTDKLKTKDVSDWDQTESHEGQKGSEVWRRKANSTKGLRSTNVNSSGATQNCLCFSLFVSFILLMWMCVFVLLCVLLFLYVCVFVSVWVCVFLRIFVFVHLDVFVCDLMLCCVSVCLFVFLWEFVLHCLVSGPVFFYFCFIILLCVCLCFFFFVHQWASKCICVCVCLLVCVFVYLCFFVYFCFIVCVSTSVSFCCVYSFVCVSLCLCVNECFVVFVCVSLFHCAFLWWTQVSRVSFICSRCLWTVQTDG